jgi:hypothetical protein
MHCEDKTYFAIVVFEVDENALNEVISSTIVGILPSQLDVNHYVPGSTVIVPPTSITLCAKNVGQR